jgi:hypothetical protein
MDDLKQLDISKLRSIFPTTDEAALPNVKLHLDGGKRYATKETRRRMVELKRQGTAREQLRKLPGKGESVHLLLDGKFSLFDLLVAVLDIAGQPCRHLTIATLGLSRSNAEHLDKMLAEGRIKQLDLLASHYFAAQDKEIWEHACGVIRQRPNCRAVAMRSHAKLFCAKIGKRFIVCTSSANLRSCVNLEQASLQDHAGLYRFLLKHLEPLFVKGKSNA